MRTKKYRSYIKRIAALLLVGVLLFPASAVDWPLSGEIADKGWNYDRNTKTMTIFPTEDTIKYSPNYNIYYRDDEYNPYHDEAYKAFYHWGTEAEHVIYEEGITAVGDGYHTCVESHECGSELSEFVKCKDITLPSSLIMTGAGAFENLPSLQSVTLNEGLQVIGQSTFYGCPKLKRIVMPSSLKKICDSAFCLSSLEYIRLNEGLEVIEDSAFFHTKLKEIIIPDSVKDIGMWAFGNCNNLKKVTLPSKLSNRVPSFGEGLGEGIFMECKKLEKVTLPFKLKELPDELFIGCKSLRHVTLPKSLRVIGGDAFTASGVETVTIPKNVTRLGWDTYYEYGMFKGCKKLKKVNITTRKLKKIGYNTLINTPPNTIFVVPKGMKKKYTKLFRKGGLSKKIKIKESKKW